MSEYWKSTPKYWCKFCTTFVKDTKFERAQHEATGRHQGAIQRSLKGVHREQENEKRQKARAQAEVARLNGLVPSASSSTVSVATGAGSKPTFQKRPEKAATLADRKTQWEQLAAMGVALPDAARTDLGLAGDWKTVSEKVVGEVNEDGEFKTVSLNKGVRKRVIDEDEEEQREATEVITKRKGWGHTYKAFPGSKRGDDDIESLLGMKKTKTAPEEDIKQEQTDDGVKAETKDESEEARTLKDIPTAEEAEAKAAEPLVKTEDDAPAAPAVVFKKRKKIAK
ncbi:U1 zinc finger domain-containing protein [Pyrenochaeta sp. DS3sAY3a]|nr:U1 zinc finger domain-containing protein [Pyrenochaeta sp. DS3sAY3a]